jgi:hypothetical protein
MIYLIPFILSILYRLRGKGRKNMGTQAGRVIFWVIPIMALNAYYLPDWYIAVIAALLSWATIAMSHGQYFLQLHYTRKENWLCVAGMSSLGVLRCVALLSGWAWYNPYVFLLVPIGVLSGLGYWIGFKLKPTYQTEYGEYITGFVFGVAYAVGVGL